VRQHQTGSNHSPHPREVQAVADSQHNSSKEIWKEVPGFPGYEVSNRGQVRSFKGRSPGGYKAAGWELKSSPQRILKQRINKGYCKVALSIEGKLFNISTHRLVLLAFIGPCPPEMEACHNDGDRTNNHLCNLRWDTKRSNWGDRHNHGTATLGEKNGLSKLTKGQVVRMRELYSEGFSQDRIGEMFSVSQHAVHNIICRKTWGHVP